MMNTPKTEKRSLSRLLPTGALVILGLALISSVIVVLLPSREPEGIQFWLANTLQRDSYVDRVAQWNCERPDAPFAMTVLNTAVAQQRMLSGFLAETPVADMMEFHDGIYAKAFLGPVEQVGFLDLTERLHAEGVYAQFNEPSFAAFTSRGRIFGLPHDVHAVLLAYRADLVEEAGIDVAEIETWEDFFRVMRPLMEDLDGDGRPDRYLLNLAETSPREVWLMLLQNDGVIFDEDGMPAFANERNARTLSTVMTWMAGPERMTTHVSSFSASGHRQQLDGVVVANLMPAWLLGLWKDENPRLGGKLKLMPVPAFERGGRRTSIWGDSMIGINKRSAHVDESWALAKALYLSPEVAEKAWRTTTILPAAKVLWEFPFFHEPDPYCGGQHVGTMFIEAAPHVPRRPSSPYTLAALGAVNAATIALRTYAEKYAVYDAEGLYPEALRLLKDGEASLKKLISRNVFAETAE